LSIYENYLSRQLEAKRISNKTLGEENGAAWLKAAKAARRNKSGVKKKI